MTNTDHFGIVVEGTDGTEFRAHLFIHDSGRWWLEGHEALEAHLRSLGEWDEWLIDLWGGIRREQRRRAA